MKVMFQSNGILFGNSSSFLSIRQLKKILRIPQDQLNILNNIPGWSSGEKPASETSTAVSQKESKKDNFKKRNCLKKADFKSSSSVESINVQNKKSSNDNFISEQEFLFFNSEKLSLSKSKSLNFLNLESSLVSEKLNKTFSLPDMEKSLVQESKLNFPYLQKENEKCDINHKLFTEFMDTAVQCKMSQSSQPVFEMPLSERIELLTATKEKVNSEISENPCKIKSDSDGMKVSRLPLTGVLQSVSESEFNKKENVITEDKKKSPVAIYNKNITEEESFVSQVLPCAQPSSVQNEAHDQKSASSNKSPEKKKLTTKRKRQNKLEKDSKKLKSLSNIDIMFSSEQVKNMIEMMKII